MDTFTTYPAQAKDEVGCQKVRAGHCWVCLHQRDLATHQEWHPSDCKVRAWRQNGLQESHRSKSSDHEASRIKYVTFRLLYLALGGSDKCFWKDTRALSPGYIFPLRPTTGHSAVSLLPPQGCLLVMFGLKHHDNSLPNLQSPPTFPVSVNGIIVHPERKPQPITKCC